MNPHTVAAILMALLVITDAFSGNHIHIFAISVSTSLFVTLVSASEAINDTSSSAAIIIGKWNPGQCKALIYATYLVCDLAVGVIVYLRTRKLDDVKRSRIGSHLIFETNSISVVNIAADLISLILAATVDTIRACDLTGVLQTFYLNMILNRWSSGHFGLGFWHKRFWKWDDTFGILLSSGTYIVGSSILFNTWANKGDDDRTKEAIAAKVIRWISSIVTALSYPQSYFKDLTRYGGSMVVRVLSYGRKPSFTGTPELKSLMGHLMLAFYILMVLVYVAYILVVCLAIHYTCEPSIRSVYALLAFQAPGIPIKTTCTKNGSESTAKTFELYSVQMTCSICGVAQRAFPLCSLLYLEALERGYFDGYDAEVQNNQEQNNQEEPQELEDLGQNENNQEEEAGIDGNHGGFFRRWGNARRRSGRRDEESIIGG